MKTSYQFLPLLVGASLLGCTQSQPTQSESEIDVPTTEFVSRLPDTAPILKVATTGSMPPFSLQDEYGNLEGIDIDAIRAVGEDQGYRIEFYKETWQNLFDSVASGNRDLAISGISYRDERAEKYGLSNSYFFNPSAIMYLKPELSITGLNDLKGLRVGGLESSKQVAQVQEMGGASDILTTTTTFLLFEALAQDKVDAIVQDLPLLEYTASNHPEQTAYIITYEDRDDPAAQQVMLMAKENTDLIASINEGIANVKATGEFAMIKGKWLSATTPATQVQ